MGSRFSTPRLSPLLDRAGEEAVSARPVAKEYEKRTRDSPRFCAALLPHVAPLLFRDLRTLIGRDLPFPTALNEDIEPSILAADVLTLIGPLIVAAIDHHSHVGVGHLDFHVGVRRGFELQRPGFNVGLELGLILCVSVWSVH